MACDFLWVALSMFPACWLQNWYIMVLCWSCVGDINQWANTGCIIQVLSFLYLAVFIRFCDKVITDYIIIGWKEAAVWHVPLIGTWSLLNCHILSGSMWHWILCIDKVSLIVTNTLVIVAQHWWKCKTCFVIRASQKHLSKVTCCICCRFHPANQHWQNQQWESKC
jgi:hypothetical protein